MSRFNLLSDAWIPVKGRSKPIKVCEIVQPDIHALDAPRADFNAALMQFLIGVLQTVIAPSNPREWRKYFASPPSENELQAKLDSIKPAFYLDGDEYRFMQDISIKENGNKANILKLIPALVGDNTIKNNMDFFMKSSQISRVSILNLAIGLYLYQNYCLSETGGKGSRHHGSFRGRNSLITLIVKEKAGLWHNLWLNVIQTRQLKTLITNNSEDYRFEWMGDNPHGRQKTDADIGLADIYWSMPRRVYADFTKVKQGTCDLSNEKGRTIEEILIKEDGIEYKTNFIKHPLIPYRVAEKTKKEPLGGVRPIKIDGAGITYGDWLALTGNETASENLIEHIKRNLEGKFNVFACGYLTHPTQAKTLCWYETKLPCYFIGYSEEQKIELDREIDRYIQASKAASDYLVVAIQNAWFDENDDKNKNQKKSFKQNKSIEIKKSFWNRTENNFYELVKSLYDDSDRMTDDVKIQKRTKWYKYLKHETLNLFNQWAFKASIKTNPKRIALAHKNLMQNLTSKSLKQDTLGLSKEQHDD